MRWRANLRSRYHYVIVRTAFPHAFRQLFSTPPFLLHNGIHIFFCSYVAYIPSYLTFYVILLNASRNALGNFSPNARPFRLFTTSNKRVPYVTRHTFRWKLNIELQNLKKNWITKMNSIIFSKNLPTHREYLRYIFPCAFPVPPRPFRPSQPIRPYDP